MQCTDWLQAAVCGSVQFLLWCICNACTFSLAVSTKHYCYTRRSRSLCIVTIRTALVGQPWNVRYCISRLHRMWNVHDAACYDRWSCSVVMLLCCEKWLNGSRSCLGWRLVPKAHCTRWSWFPCDKGKFFPNVKYRSIACIQCGIHQITLASSPYTSRIYPVVYCYYQILH